MGYSVGTHWALSGQGQGTSRQDGDTGEELKDQPKLPRGVKQSGPRRGYGPF